MVVSYIVRVILCKIGKGWMENVKPLLYEGVVEMILPDACVVTARKGYLPTQNDQVQAKS